MDFVNGGGRRENPAFKTGHPRRRCANRLDDAQASHRDFRHAPPETDARLLHARPRRHRRAGERSAVPRRDGRCRQWADERGHRTAVLSARREVVARSGRGGRRAFALACARAPPPVRPVFAFRPPRRAAPPPPRHPPPPPPPPLPLPPPPAPP